MNDFDLPDDLVSEIERSLIEQGVPEVEVATVIANGGERVYLPIQRTAEGDIVSQTILEAVQAADLAVPPSTQFWVEGQVVDPGVVHIAPGMNIAAYGNIKGG
jgi:hypothetical protein